MIGPTRVLCLICKAQIAEMPAVDEGGRTTTVKSIGACCAEAMGILPYVPSPQFALSPPIPDSRQKDLESRYGPRNFGRKEPS